MAGGSSASPLSTPPTRSFTARAEEVNAGSFQRRKPQSSIKRRPKGSRTHGEAAEEAPYIHLAELRS